MGLRDLLFGHAPKPDKKAKQTFQMLNGYTPVFTNHSGSIYEAELIRSAIHARATNVSKLKVDVLGTAKPALRNKLKHGPNQFMTWSQFLYRLSTILDIANTAFIVPVYDELGEISGIYPPNTQKCEVVEYGGVLYLRYKFGWGQTAAIELESCAIMTKHQYRSDFFGEDNKALLPTLDLISIQDQGIKEGVKSAATYRFTASVANFADPEDLAEERKRFTSLNLSKDAEGGGILLFPNTYKDIRQVDVKPWVVDAEQMKIINDNVFRYYGVNDDVIQNKAYGDSWTAFYEGAVEPFCIQFSEVMTKMLFTFREQSQGNEVIATSNRLQYMSNADKLNVSSQMLDRGIISLNDAREIWNLPPVEGGDVRIIRGEYYDASTKVTEQEEPDESES